MLCFFLDALKDDLLLEEHLWNTRDSFECLETLLNAPVLSKHLMKMLSEK